MGRQSVLDQLDRATGGQVKAKVLGARGAGDSYEKVAADLREDGIVVTGETVRQWVLSLGDAPIKDQEPAA